MNYIESEVDTTLIENSINHIKKNADQTHSLIRELTDSFFLSPSNILDPTDLANVDKHHDPDYWKKISTIKNCQKPILIILDKNYHSWELTSTDDLQLLISESTGFPFWITTSERNLLIYLDDHDCVHIAHKKKKP